MTNYADYQFYTDEYRQGYKGGNFIGEDAFPYLAGQATAYIINFTHGLSDKVTDEKSISQIKMAMCALVEVLNDENAMSTSAFTGGKKVSSESVGRWSRSFAATNINGSDVNYLNKKKIDVLYLYLGNLAEFAGLFKVTSYRYM